MYYDVDKLRQIKYYIDSLCVYDVRDDEVVNALYELLNDLDSSKMIRSYSKLFMAITENGSLKHHIAQCILRNDNIYTRACCTGQEHRLSKKILQAVKIDLDKLEKIASLKSNDIISRTFDDDYRKMLKTIPSWEVGESEAPLSEGWGECMQELAAYYQQNGYGIFSSNIAFAWREGKLMPITSTDPVRLSDLKDYEEQRQRVIENTEAFLTGVPANNVLLYGDRGTGKSATVHAILNEYSIRGLRMIEVPKSAVSELSLIREAIADSPMKFIIFIDDLSFDSNDDSYAELKASLEGSLSVKQANTLIYATSNRRHLIRENFSDRQDDMHSGDVIQEQLSLSDRFGLTITFINPTKDDYLNIVKKIIEDRAIGFIDEEHLFEEAEKWAQRHGDRSPRSAKQFADYVEGAVKRGVSW
ncbi:MAG: ATP-binding protein [Eubacterium sp.]|nr:ATP-binding protein [Eubacterium sp.]